MIDEPHTIDCHEALDRLYEYLDGELTPVRAEEVRLHIEMCAPCLAASSFENAYVRFLEARTWAQKAPEGLRKKILEQILFEGERSETT
jgi:anti-sigma factor (TIGR02949 family)